MGVIITVHQLNKQIGNNPIKDGEKESENKNKFKKCPYFNLHCFYRFNGN